MERAVSTKMSREPDIPRGWSVENGGLVLDREGSDAGRRQGGACTVAGEGPGCGRQHHPPPLRGQLLGCVPDSVKTSPPTGSLP